MRPMIYTGYQWRTMKDDEIEIMCEENIVVTMPRYPEAGDIYRLGTNEKRLEELKSILQDPCEYCCENPKSMQTKSIYMFCKIKHVSKNFFNLQFGETINGPIEGFIRFSFCPMCGRKLEDAK